MISHTIKISKPNHIHVAKTACAESGNNPGTNTALSQYPGNPAKAEELFMKLEPDERLVVGTAYCGQDLKTGELLELVPPDYFPLIIQEPPVIIPAAIHPSFSRLFYYMRKHPCVRRGMTDLAEGEVRKPDTLI